ncbi:MAG: hypothetical protein WC760_04715 [Bacteroidia bacterium]|jgi:hypothetical protein
MNRIIRNVAQTYQIFSNLSLDIVAGVVCNMLPLPYVFGFEPGPGWYLGLPLATWFIYLADHLADNLFNPYVITERHQFIRDNRNQVLNLLMGIGVLLVIILYYYFDLALFLSGIITGMLCVLYFTLNRIRHPFFHLIYNKELVVAIVYATGFYAIAGMYLPLLHPWLVYYLLLIGLVYQNILMISILEIKTDRNNKQFSWASAMGERFSNKMFVVISLICLLLMIAAYITFPQLNPLLLYGYLTIWFAQVILFNWLAHRMHEGTFRKISEMIFWIPLLFYLLLK